MVLPLRQRDAMATGGSPSYRHFHDDSASSRAKNQDGRQAALSFEGCSCLN